MLFQTRYVLSSCRKWQPNDDNFVGEEFYKRLVSMFDAENIIAEEWATETLAWWNMYYFGSSHPHTRTDTLLSGRRVYGTPTISSRNSGPSRRPGNVTRSQAEIQAEQRAARAAQRAAQDGAATEEALSA